MLCPRRMVSGRFSMVRVRMGGDKALKEVKIGYLQLYISGRGHWRASRGGVDLSVLEPNSGAVCSSFALFVPSQAACPARRPS